MLANHYHSILVAIPAEHQSRRNLRPRILISSLQPGDTHETVARVLCARFEFDARVINECDPVSIAMAVRDSQALVLVGAPTVENMQSPAVEEAISSMIPVVALCAEFGESQDAPAGISLCLTPNLALNIWRRLCLLSSHDNERFSDCNWTRRQQCDFRADYEIKSTSFKKNYNWQPAFSKNFFRASCHRWAELNPPLCGDLRRMSRAISITSCVWTSIILDSL